MIPAEEEEEEEEEAHTSAPSVTAIRDTGHLNLFHKCWRDNPNT